MTHHWIGSFVKFTILYDGMSLPCVKLTPCCLKQKLKNNQYHIINFNPPRSGITPGVGKNPIWSNLKMQTKPKRLPDYAWTQKLGETQWELIFLLGPLWAAKDPKMPTLWNLILISAHDYVYIFLCTLYTIIGSHLAWNWKNKPYYREITGQFVGF